jgi:hypothetical protein
MSRTCPEPVEATGFNERGTEAFAGEVIVFATFVYTPFVTVVALVAVAAFPEIAIEYVPEVILVE